MGNYTNFADLTLFVVSGMLISASISLAVRSYKIWKSLGEMENTAGSTSSLEDKVCFSQSRVKVFDFNNYEYSNINYLENNFKLGKDIYY